MPYRTSVKTPPIPDKPPKSCWKRLRFHTWYLQKPEVDPDRGPAFALSQDQATLEATLVVCRVCNAVAGNANDVSVGMFLDAHNNTPGL